MLFKVGEFGERVEKRALHCAPVIQTCVIWLMSEALFFGRNPSGRQHAFGEKLSSRSPSCPAINKGGNPEKKTAYGKIGIHRCQDAE